MDAARWMKVACVLLALAVGTGAFGAHALRNSLDEKMLAVWQTATLYHFLHALGLLAVAGLATANVLTGSSHNLVCSLLLFGILVFSGSLYALALTGIKILGAITPLGGVAFIAAWLLLAVKITAD